MIGQCPTAVYQPGQRVIPQNSTVFIGVDYSGTGTTVGGIGITPDPSNPAPKFTLGAPSANGVNAGVNFVSGAANWNQQDTGSGVVFTGGTAQWTMNGIVSTAWPKATVTYHDTLGNPHTQIIDVTTDPTSATAAAISQVLLDYDANGKRNDTTSAGFVTLINTNGSLVVAGNTIPFFNPTGANFDGALMELGGHETGHQLGLGDQPTAVAGDIMSKWNTTVSNPTGITNNQDGHAGQFPSQCDALEIKNNPNSPYQPPPPPPDPPTDNCQVNGCTCGGTCEKDGTCTYTFDCSPILIAVGESADIRLTSPDTGVYFDLEATGKKQWTAWTQKDEQVAFLVRDVNHNGIIDNGSELFGNHTLLPNGVVSPNGFAALAAYDRPENGGNGDGVIDAKDAIWPELMLWIDSNHNGLSEGNELYHLDDFGLTQISLDYKMTNRTDEFGNVFRFKSPCQLAGKVRFGYDVFFSARPPRKQ